MVNVRKANFKDNDILLNIQQRSPQGTFFVFVADSSPNYFNRTKPYQDGHVFVAEEDGQVIGSTACAFLDTVVSGLPSKAAYGYGLMVDPDHRRKGIATKLGEQVRTFISQRNVDIHFVIIVEGNVPSINLVNKMGYALLHDFLLVRIYITEGQDPTHPEYIRTMKEDDAGIVAKLLNENYLGYDLYKPFTGESFLEEIERYPFFEMDNINLFEDEKGIQACLGYWDYNNITRYKPLKIPQEMIDRLTESNAPFIPRLGVTSSIYFSHYPAYRDGKCFKDLIRYTNKILQEEDATYLSFPVNAASPMHNILTEFPHNFGNIHIYAKPVEGREFPNFGKNPVYVEPAHI